MRINDSISDNYPVTKNFAANQTIELLAIPRYGYSFSGWSGKTTAMTESISITMTCNMSYTANFATVKHRVQTIASPLSGGEIIMEPPQPDEGYELGTTVTVTAKPAHGYNFKIWEGTGLITSGNKATFVVGSDNFITAVFEERQSSTWVWIVVGGCIMILGALLFIFILRRRRISQTRGSQS